MSLSSLMSAITPTILRNGHPRMIGTFLSSSISITTKSPSTKNFPTYIGMSSTIPKGNLIEAFASWIVILIGFKLVNAHMHPGHIGPS
jgi:hypothetical protein